MNRAETLDILSNLKVIYPHSFKKMSSNDQRIFVESWERQFKDCTYKQVRNAIDSIISSNTSDFAPNIATIKQMILSLEEPDQLTEQEAWNLVYHAICNISQTNTKEFDNLPMTLQRLVGSPSQLREWGQMNTDQVQSVISSNFQRSYRNALISDKEQSLLPNDVKQMIGGGTCETKQIE